MLKPPANLTLVILFKAAMFASNSPYEAEVKVTPEKHSSASSILPKLSSGKLVKPEQPPHAPLKPVPAEVSKSGKLVKPGQSYHANLKFVPADVSNNGKLVKPQQ